MHVFNVTVVSNSSYLYPQWLLAGSEKEKKNEFFHFPLKKIKANKLKKKKRSFKTRSGFCSFNMVGTATVVLKIRMSPAQPQSVVLGGRPVPSVAPVGVRSTPGQEDAQDSACGQRR